MRSRFTTLGVVVALAGLAGCAFEGALVEPTLAGKADVDDSVSRRGALEMIEGLADASDELTEDFEFHAYTFTAAAGSVVDLEVTQRGTSRGLDTTLFVYAPSPGGYQRIAVDDDSGWGPLSKIEGLTLPEEATYLAVVGTKLADGRGTYRLELRCASGDCASLAVPAGCPSEYLDVVNDCVDEVVADEVYDGNRANPSAALIGCFSDDPSWPFETVCRGWSPPTWCDAGITSFEEHNLPTCRAELAALYPPPPPPVRLVRRPMDPEVQRRIGDYYSDYASLDGASYTVAEGQPDVTAVRILETLRGDYEVPFGAARTTPPETFHTAASYNGLGDDIYDLLRADAGSDAFEVGHVSASFYAAPGAQAWVDLYAILFDNGVVYSFYFEAGEP